MTSIPAETLRSDGHPIGEVFLSAAEIDARVTELGRALAARYDGLEPVLVAPLKSSIVFLTDLSRTLRIDHALDTVELSPYAGASGAARLTKDLGLDVTGRHVVVVEDIVDTGLTLGFLARSLAARRPASLSAVTLLDRPYRRLVDDLPLDHVGFTVPDELFAGYGLGLDERWRALRDIHVVIADELPAVLGAA